MLTRVNESAVHTLLNDLTARCQYSRVVCLEILQPPKDRTVDDILFS